MNESKKVVLPKEVAEAIEEFIADCTNGRRSINDAKAVLAAEHYGQDWRDYEDGQYLALNGIKPYELMKALVNGYVVEKAPEEKIQEYYEKISDIKERHDLDLDRGVLIGVKTTLNILGITIEGING